MIQDELIPVIQQIPMLREYSIDDLEITALPGLTNSNYRIQAGKCDWVLRIPRSQSNAFIDRVAEAHNQQQACLAGIAPKVLWRDPHGHSLTPTLTQTRQVCASDFADPVRLKQILEPVQQLHRSAAIFRGSVDPWQTLTGYFLMLPRNQQEALENRMDEAKIRQQQISNADIIAVPSHNDLVLENLMLGDERVWLIDWEFSSMASPYWDLATLCNAARLEPKDAAELLQIYCSGRMQMEESVLSDFRFLLQLLGDCWLALLALQK